MCGGTLGNFMNNAFKNDPVGTVVDPASANIGAIVQAGGLTEANNDYLHDTGPLGKLYESFIFSGGFGDAYGSGAAGAGGAEGIDASTGQFAGETASSGSAGSGGGFSGGEEDTVLFPGESSTSGQAVTTGASGDSTVIGDPASDTADGASIVGPDGMQTLSPETAQLLGVNPAGDFTGNVGDYTGGMSLSPGASGATIETVPDSGPMDIPSSGGGGGGSGDGYFGQAADLLKKIGLSPASAGLLGLSAAQALSKPKAVQASKAQEGMATQNAQAASAVLQSGGTSSPAWAGQKASIDTTIDEQIRQQVAAMMQQAQNSGQGADSQVTQQQINKIKNQLETQRQTLYAQAQQQNVQAALQQLGISNSALSSVAGQQFSASNSAKSSAAQTAALALQLQALQNKGVGGGSASVAPQGNQNSA